MTEKIDSHARNALGYAQEEARHFKHNFCGTEHLIIGLYMETEGIAHKVLEYLDVNEDVLRSALQEFTGFGSTDYSGDPGKYVASTPRVIKIIKAADKWLKPTHKEVIGTEHILLQIAEEGDGIAISLLKNMKITPTTIMKAYFELESKNNRLNPEDFGLRPSDFLDADEQDSVGGDGLFDNFPGFGGDDEDGGGFPMFQKIKGNSGKKGKTAIESYTVNLTNLAIKDELDPVIGRENEVERAQHIISRRLKNNPILIGEPGVGKTAIVERLASNIASGNVPLNIFGFTVLSLDLTSVVAGTVFRGQFEQRIKQLIDEIKENGKIILFIDEIHTLIGAGSGEGSMDAANILKPALARGEIRVIGATTLDEYQKYFEKDAALTRRFQPIIVDEPSQLESLRILEGIKESYEKYHNVLYTKDSLELAVKLSDRYVTDRHLPDKAIDLVDEAGAYLSTINNVPTDELKEVQKQIQDVELNMENFGKKEKEYKYLALEKNKLQDSLENILEDLTAKNEKPAKVESSHIAEILSKSTGIPVSKLTSEDAARLSNMEEILHKRIIGQDAAIKSISQAIRRTFAGLKDPKRPSGSFIFAGPTGVGKTELTKTLAEFLFDDEEALIQFDMSEFAEKYTASKLFGAPPGYVGHEQGGELTEKVRRKPFSIILFDEIEKAHPDIFNTLLQILEEGRLTDGRGRVVDFKNTIIIMTTNLGGNDITKSQSTGFSGNNKQDDSDYLEMKAKVTTALNGNFRPEFLNRIDDVIVFPQLSKDEVRQIAQMYIEKLSARLEERNINIKFDDKALDTIVEIGYDPMLGARPLRRAINKYIEDEISERIIFGEINDGNSVEIGVEKYDEKKKEDSKFSFSVNK